MQTIVGPAFREIGRVNMARLEGALERRGDDLCAEARQTARADRK